MSNYNLDKAVEVIERAVEEAEEYQAQLEHNKESVKLIDIVAKFLKRRKRLLYGGYAINALLPKQKRFYDPKKELPDFDFLSPDPLTDVAELIQDFIAKGYKDVEPAFGIHEGTYKVFVNFQGVADITFCEPVIYETLQKESIQVDSLHVCPPDYLRMNMYVELSHPSGDITRWAKVYRRLLLLNEARPFRGPKDCHRTESTTEDQDVTPLQKRKLYGKFLHQIQKSGDILLGIQDSEVIFENPKQSSSGRMKTLKQRMESGPFLTISLSSAASESAKGLQKAWKEVLGTGISLREVNKLGELLPERVELVYNESQILGVVFQTSACHAYYDVKIGSKQYKVGSIDTLLNFYFAFFYGKVEFTNAQTSILCTCQKLLDLAYQTRVTGSKTWPFPAFAISCVGYQPTLAELKKQHRERVRQERQKKKAEIAFRKTVRAKMSIRSAKKTRKVKNTKKTKQK